MEIKPVLAAVGPAFGLIPLKFHALIIYSSVDISMMNGQASKHLPGPRSSFSAPLYFPGRIK
jgi:hypothetical protein